MWKQRGDFCMKIAICDDEQPVLNQLRKFINQYALDNLFDYTILEFSKSERLLEAASQDPDIKILFLDIYMSPLSGMDLAEILRANGNDCAIIFVTVSTEHYARSYEVDAAHYLVKPVTYDRVKMALDRCHQVLTASSKFVFFSAGGKEIRLPLREIRFVEVFRNQTVIHADSDITLRSTLDAVMHQLSDSRFLRTHRSYLVNMDYITKRNGNDLYLSSGDKVPLSRTCEKTFEREYGRYLTVTITGDKT